MSSSIWRAVLGAGSMLGIGSLTFAAQSGSIELPRGECVLVMQIRDLIGPTSVWTSAGGDSVAEGSGGALVQSLHNALVELGLSARASTFAATVNALEQARELGCAHVLRPHHARLGRNRVVLGLELLDTRSGDVLASCEQRETGARVEELLRPAALDCLRQLVTPSSGSMETRASAGRMLVVPFSESWVFRPAATTALEQAAVDAALDLLHERGHEALSAPPVENRRQLLARARQEGCMRVLAVGVGVLRSSLDPPPLDAPLGVFVDLIDVTSGQTLMTAQVQSTETIPVAESAGLLTASIECALHALLARARACPPAAAGRLALSVIEPPAVVWTAQPVYPSGARRERVEGTVVVGFVVDTRGRVSDVEILESIPELDQAVITAIKRSRRTPGRRDGTPSPMYMIGRYEFSARQRR